MNGVPKENIAIGGTDTVTDRDCYSYRRESGKNRSHGFIWYATRTVVYTYIDL